MNNSTHALKLLFTRNVKIKLSFPRRTAGERQQIYERRTQSGNSKSSHTPMTALVFMLFLFLGRFCNRRVVRLFRRLHAALSFILFVSL